MVGTSGIDSRFDGTFLRNSLVVWSQVAVNAIEDGIDNLSAAYHYTALPEQGTFNGVRYLFRMTGIIGNHEPHCRRRPRAHRRSRHRRRNAERIKTMNDFNATVGRLAAQIAWRIDYKLAAAKTIVTSNAVRGVDQSARQFALDAMPKSFRGDRTNAE